ncbi:putative Transmembrane protein 65 [Nannochloris sp. 'desiccata']|nr:putative Transmembrane protein 65 [Chlorella desiccata (nom. nud.)]
MQCSLLVQQALGRLDQPRHTNSSSRSSSSAVPPTPETELDTKLVAGTVQKAFNRAPRETAAAILHGLGELDRVHLLLALQTSTSRETLQKRDTEYVDDLVKIVKASPLHSGLTRGQIANAIAYQRMLQRYSSYSQKPPTAMQLGAVMLASGLPFLGFGFCDNLVMIVAGDAIDSLFGAKLGITTLASAGLGNIVADVVGVSATQQIKERSRKIKWAQPPRLSTLQQAMGSVKFAKMGGACLGVSIGCVLGMLPLAFMPPGFFEEPGSGHGHSHAAAADNA